MSDSQQQQLLSSWKVPKLFLMVPAATALESNPIRHFLLSMTVLFLQQRRLHLLKLRMKRCQMWSPSPLPWRLIVLAPELLTGRRRLRKTDNKEKHGTELLYIWNGHEPIGSFCYIHP